MTREGRCNDLEALLLSMIVSGICSGYAMKKEMRRMRTNRWSTESGSIYRALKRLLAAGLIRESGKVGVPLRPRTEYEVTDAGRQQALGWLARPVHRDELELIGDGLRDKCRYLGVLDPRERARVAEGWLAANGHYASELRAGVDRSCSSSDPYAEVACEGLLLAVEARQKWLLRLRALIESQP